MCKDQMFEELVSNYSTYLKALAIRITENHDDAQDLVQTVLLRAWRNLDSLKEPKSLKAWLTTILVRENARRFSTAMSRLKYNSEIELDSLPARDAGASHVDSIAVSEAIGGLDSNYAIPLLMQALHGYTTKEISKQLSITAGAVLVRTCRARKMMREALV